MRVFFHRTPCICRKEALPLAALWAVPRLICCQTLNDCPRRRRSAAQSKGDREGIVQFNGHCCVGENKMRLGAGKERKGKKKEEKQNPFALPTVTENATHNNTKHGAAGFECRHIASVLCGLSENYLLKKEP